VKHIPRFNAKQSSDCVAVTSQVLVCQACLYCRLQPFTHLGLQLAGIHLL
jgi:hypothetical protein